MQTPHSIARAASAAAAAASRGRLRSRSGRAHVERCTRAALQGCALLSIASTFGIIAILVFQSWEFFGMPEVSLWEFATGTNWSPLLGAEKHFGVWPLVTGTLLVTAIAACFALPVGLVTAIYLSEYAPGRVRATLKPVLEVLAGIPTVVYGFFALEVITPFLQGAFNDALARGGGSPWIPAPFGTYNATSAGLAVGIMILPIVASLSEDALRAVPRSLRDAAYGLGSTRFDVSVKVVVPAALSGIMASWMLAITRAIGETMIVALAAGGLAHLTLSPSAEVQTMTAYMVQIFLGDAPAYGVEYRSCYAVATVLFAMTLALTIVGNLLLRAFREEYD
jgi:phosphate transport system permease protein